MQLNPLVSSYFLFGSFCLLATIFVIFLTPEAKGKTSEDMNFHIMKNLLFSNLPLTMQVQSGKDDLFWRFGAHNPFLSKSNHWLKCIGTHTLLFPKSSRVLCHQQLWWFLLQTHHKWPKPYLEIKMSWILLKL